MPPPDDLAESSSSGLDGELTESDVSRYQSLKQKLNASEKNQAQYLWEIKSEELYLAEYETFKQFVEHEVGWSRRQADRLANWGHILSMVPNGPTCEAQARPLASIEEEEDIKEIWKQAQVLADDCGSSMTSALVRKARGQYLANSNEQGSEQTSDDKTETELKTKPPSPDNPESSQTHDTEGQSTTQGGNPPADKTTGDSSNEDSSSDADGPEEKGQQTGENRSDAPPAPSPGLAVSVTIPEEVASEHDLKKLADGRDQQRDLQIPLEDLGLTPLQQIVDEMSPEKAPPLAKSLSVADGFTFPLEGPTDPRKNIPDPEDALGQPDTLSLRTLVQIQGKTGRDATCKILISPGLDLFAPAVPGDLQQVVLKACRGIEPTVLLTTDHPSEVPGSDVPESVWIGVRTSFSTLQETETQLKEADLTSAWVRLDLEKADLQTELPLAEKSPVDWLICRGPEEPVRKEAYDRFLQSASDAGTELFFLDPVSVVHQAQPRLGEDSRAI